MNASLSPYAGLPPVDWPAKTQQLLQMYPLALSEIVSTVLEAWESIFSSAFDGFQIGIDIFPKPQAMGLFLHELTPLILARKYPAIWRDGRRKDEKDLIYMPDSAYSTEMKTSSHPTKIFGNRSYAQKGNSKPQQKTNRVITSQ